MTEIEILSERIAGLASRVRELEQKISAQHQEVQAPVKEKREHHKLIECQDACSLHSHWLCSEHKGNKNERCDTCALAAHMSDVSRSRSPGYWPGLGR